MKEFCVLQSSLKYLLDIWSISVFEVLRNCALRINIYLKKKMYSCWYSMPLPPIISWLFLYVVISYAWPLTIWLIKLIIVIYEVNILTKSELCVHNFAAFAVYKLCSLRVMSPTISRSSCASSLRVAVFSLSLEIVRPYFRCYSTFCAWVGVRPSDPAFDLLASKL